MAKRAVIRPYTGVAVTILVAVVAVVSVALLVQAGDVDTARRFGPPFITLAYLTWLLFWWPMVELAKDALVVRNPLRTFRMPWASVDEVENRFSLIVTAAGRSVTAWAAPSARRRPSPGLLRRLRTLGGRPDADDSTADLAAAVRRQAEKVRGVAGPSSTGVVVRWNVIPAVVAVVLVAASIVLAAV